MVLKFKEWLDEAKRPVSVNSDVKKWFDSADKLKQTIEKLKAALKDKKPEIEKEKEPVKVDLSKKLDKPEIGKKDKEEIKGKNFNKEVDKNKNKNPEPEKDVKKDVAEKIKDYKSLLKDDKKGLNNGRRPERSDI